MVLSVMIITILLKHIAYMFCFDKLYFKVKKYYSRCYLINEDLPTKIVQ